MGLRLAVLHPIKMYSRAWQRLPVGHCLLLQGASAIAVRRRPGVQATRYICGTVGFGLLEHPSQQACCSAWWHCQPCISMQRLMTPDGADMHDDLEGGGLLAECSLWLQVVPAAELVPGDIVEVSGRALGCFRPSAASAPAMSPQQNHKVPLCLSCSIDKLASTECPPASFHAASLPFTCMHTTQLLRHTASVSCDLQLVRKYQQICASLRLPALSSELTR